MSFQVLEILEVQPEGIRAQVRHQNNQANAILPNTQREDIPVGKSFQAEIGYDGILDWKVISDFNDAESGIWQGKDGVHLLGRIHSVVDFGDGVIMIDVYMQTGPEFFVVHSEAINNEIPEGNDGLEIIASNLYLYPTDTYKATIHDI